MRRLTRLLTIAATTLVVAAATASAGAAVGTIREYTGPIDVAGAQLVDIATGPNGNLWFTESGVGKIGRLDPRTGTIVEFDAGCGQPNQITLGADGNLWYTCSDGGVIGRITPLGTATTFRTRAYVPMDIVSGPDGNLWFTDWRLSRSGQLFKVTTAGTTVGQYTVGDLPTGITVGGDGDLWVGMQNEAIIARVTTAGVVTRFPTSGYPGALATGPAGNVWYGTTFGVPYLIGRVASDGAVTGTYPYGGLRVDGITRGPFGNLWYTTASAVTRITTTGVATDFTAGIAPGASPQGITTGSDGNMWFVTKSQSHVYRLLTGAVPTNTIAPTLSGKTAIGSKLTTDPGGWQNQPTTYAYRWERCTSANGTGCTVISGRTASTYTTTAADSGAFIRVGVTATNANGESTRLYSTTLSEDRAPDNGGGSNATGGGSAAGGGESASGGAVTPLGPTVGPTLLGNETIRSIDGTSTRITTTVKVTAAGHLAQTAHAAGLLACRTSANPTTAGTVTLVCRLSVRAKAILTQRALRIAVTTTFTPHGFPTVTVTRLIKIPRAAGSSLPVVG